MKALADYLKPPVPEKQRREQGALDLRAMISNRKSRQKKGTDDGTR